MLPTCKETGHIENEERKVERDINCSVKNLISSKELHLLPL